MAFNIEAGYGKLSQSMPFSPAGQLFVVGKAGLAGIDIIKQRIKPYAGKIRYFADLDSAINKAVANRGDVIMVAEGHTENVTTAADIAIDVAGLSIIGLGNGNNRPVFTFNSSDNSATMTMSGNNTKLHNVVLVCGDDGLTNALVVSGDNCDVDIESQDASSTVEFATVVRGDTANNLKLKLKHNGFTGGNAVVSLVRLDDCDNVRVEVDAFGVVTTAWVEMVDVASTNVHVFGRLYTQGVTNFSRLVVDTITGSTWTGLILDASAGSMVVGSNVAAFTDADVSSIATAIGVIDGYHDVPTADATANAQMRDVLGNKTDAAAAGAVSATESVMAYAKQLVGELQTLQAELSGSAGLTSFPNAAPAGNGTSLAEVIRFIEGQIVNGSGTTLPNNTSLWGALAGASGIPAFPSAAAPANDVSLAEVIRAIYDRQLGDGTNSNTNSRLGKKVTRNAADIFDGSAAKSLFTVSGGRVLLTHLEAEVTTAAIDASTSNLKFLTNPTAGTDMDLSANLDINADENGSIYSITGVVGDATTGGSGGGAMGMQRPVVVPEGAIAMTTSADVGTGGALGKCELWYIPLDDGATVVAA